MINDWLYWLIAASFKGALVVLAALTVTYVFRHSLPPRWRYGVWLLVVLRLCLPVAARSEVSVFRLDDNALRNAWTRTSTASVLDLVAIPSAQDEQAVNVGATRGPDVATVLWLVWISGALLVAGRAIAAFVRLGRHLERAEPPEDPALCEQVDRLARRLGLHHSVSVLESDWLKTPALFGILRPRIVLPAGSLQTLRQTELEHILLHELAHLRRRDHLVQHLTTLLTAMHWWNPLVRLGFRRMRADGELACDDLVLRHLADGQRAAYARTLLRVLERASTAKAVPAVAMAETYGDLSRRVRWIQRGAPGGRGHRLLAMTLVLGLGAVTLTDALQNDRSKARLSVAQKEAIAQIRSVGAALMEWTREHPHPRRTGEEQQETDDGKHLADWGVCPPITHAELRRVLVPDYLHELPVSDAWGMALEYCLARDAALARRHQVGIRSAGSDGRFAASHYAIGAFPAQRTSEDLVWIDGYFVRWPTPSPEP